MTLFYGQLEPTPKIHWGENKCGVKQCWKYRRLGTAFCLLHWIARHQKAIREAVRN